MGIMVVGQRKKQQLQNMKSSSNKTEEMNTGNVSYVHSTPPLKPAGFLYVEGFAASSALFPKVVCKISKVY